MPDPKPLPAYATPEFRAWLARIVRDNVRRHEQMIERWRRNNLEL